MWSPDKYLFQYFRRVFRWSPAKKQCMAESEKAAGKAGYRRCESCKQIFKKHLVVADHVEPVVDPKTGFQGWDTHYKRMFVPREKLQALCKEEHRAKTSEENKERRAVRKSKRSDMS